MEERVESREREGEEEGEEKEGEGEEEEHTACKLSTILPTSSNPLSNSKKLSKQTFFSPPLPHLFLFLSPFSPSFLSSTSL